MHLRRLIVLAAVAAFGSAALAANPAYRPDLATLPAVPRHELPAVALQHALDDAAAHPIRERYAVRVPMGLALGQGLWDKADAQTARWRLRLSSPGALSMSAHLFPITLPTGAQLHVYGADAKTVLGPFTQSRVTPSGYWTPIVPGDELVLEVTGPIETAKDWTLTVAEAFHGIRDIAKAGLGPQPGASGSCNRNVACDTNWTAENRSVALITIGNVAYCSGQLLNNTQQDFKPYFLTAHHCGINHSNGPDSSVNFYFNFQATTCSGTPPSTYDLVQGSNAKADDTASDFTLLLIATSTSNRLPANAYFAGWDAMGNAPASAGASFHHPSGDDKKISVYDSITDSTVNIGSGCTIDAWQVHWASGTTEEGSSGGGLWDGSSHALIGTLSGGGAACNSPDLPDYFARLDRAWTAHGDASGQLKAWLNPDGSCVAKVPGLPNGTNSPGPVQNDGSNIKCEGPASSCQGGGFFGGGGFPASLLVAMLTGVALRARRARRQASAPDDQKHSGDCHD